MRLLTLGGLSVEGASYGREKPLVLLTYLCLEGQQTRKHLADLFWPDAANRMNSLAQHLIRLRPLGAVVRENDKWVESLIDCDAAVFRAHHRAGRTHEAVNAYRGAFLDGVRLGIGSELEDWLLGLRDTLGAEARSAHLTLAEHHHARGEYDQAALHAESAYGTPGAAPCEPEDIPRIYRLLGRSDHPLVVTLKREAQELDLTLPSTPEPTPPTVNILGRQAELAQLRDLRPNQIVWISGPPGIGKTALLGALASAGGWRVLPARNGLPLGTLEPISPHPLTSTADALNALRDNRLKLAVDGWEDCDDTTRTALTLAARQHPGATIVITARQPPAIPADHHLPLHPLTENELQTHPGAHAATGGHPMLLAAYLQGTPAERNLDAHLNVLGDVPRRLFLALAAQEEPHLNATRAALNLTAAELAGGLDTLTREGLTTPEGTVRATTPTRDLLHAHPQDTKLLHLHLARTHPIKTAWPHWLKAKDLWESEDEAACAAAAHWYADQEMKRGYPAKAARTLEVAPQTDEVKLLRGWALIECGQSPVALTLASKIPASPERDALLATALIRTGRTEEAVDLAQQVPRNGSRANAHSQGVLAHAARLKGDFVQAATHYARSAALWQLHDNPSARVDALALEASMHCKAGADPENEFPPILATAQKYPSNLAAALLNYGVELKAKGRLTQAISVMKEAGQSFQNCGNLEGEAHALNNLGAYFHLSGAVDQARQSYHQAWSLLRGSGNLRLLGFVLTNLAEIEDDLTGFDDALSLLKEAGEHDIASRIMQAIRPEFAQRLGHGSVTVH